MQIWCQYYKAYFSRFNQFEMLLSMSHIGPHIYRSSHKSFIIIFGLRQFFRRCWVRLTQSYGPSFYTVVYVRGSTFSRHTSADTVFGQVLFGLPTRAVPSTTNHARSCLACRHEPSPPPPIMPGLVWPVNRSRPLHHQSCQVLFGLPTRAVPSTTNHARSCLACQHEPSPPPPIMPGLVWPANRSRPLHHQSCQVLFGLPTRGVPSTTNHARSCLACRHEPSPPPPIMPGLVWSADTSRPLHHQSCQVLFGLPT